MEIEKRESTTVHIKHAGYMKIPYYSYICLMYASRTPAYTQSKFPLLVGDNFPSFFHHRPC